MKITSSGIIRNEDKPRVGVTSKAHPEFLDDCITQGIDLGYESALAETIAEIQGEIAARSEDIPSEHEAERDMSAPKLTADDSDGIEAEAQSRLECLESSGPYLIGDWRKNAEGLYEIDHNGSAGYAAQFNSGSMGDIVTVEWSKTTKRCHHTSPCFVMSDGSGPCGDLDTVGDSVVAYCLPDDCMESAEET